MPIPDYQSLMKPFLDVIADGRDYRFADVVGELADRLGLTDEEREQMLPSGRRSLFYDRVSWAKTYLAKARLIESSGRGLLRITERGRVAIRERPDRIDNNYLMQFSEFVEFIQRSRPGGDYEPRRPTDVEHVPERTPEENLSFAYEQIRSATISELLERIQRLRPRAFERLALDVLQGMGYGARGELTQMTRDDGIDGVIPQDQLGLEAVYIQAKRWVNPVGREEVQKFSGAMDGHRATKGVFITSSSFTEDAKVYVQRTQNKKIVLIDGQRLAELMFEWGIGVSVAERIEVKRVDSDYFSDLDGQFATSSS